MRSDRENLQKKVNLAKIQKQALETESKTLQHQKGTLENAANTTSQLLQRCNNISSSSSETKDLVRTRLTEYHDLILRTDDFKAWSEDLTSQVELIKAIGPSEVRMRRTTKRIVGTLLDTNHAEMKAICDRLGRLNI